MHLEAVDDLLLHKTYQGQFYAFLFLVDIQVDSEPLFPTICGNSLYPSHNLCFTSADSLLVLPDMSFILPSSSSHKSHGSSASSSRHKTYVYTRPAGSTHSTSRSVPLGGGGASPFFAAAGLPGFASTSRGSGGTSYYKRRSRDGYVARLVAKIKSLLADLYRYIRKNPVKVLLPIAMALISGGALHNLARSMGVTLPEGLKHLVGMGDAARSVRGGYDAWYGSQSAGGQGGGGGGGFGGMGGAAGAWLGTGLKVASAFI